MLFLSLIISTSKNNVLPSFSTQWKSGCFYGSYLVLKGHRANFNITDRIINVSSTFFQHQVLQNIKVQPKIYTPVQDLRDNKIYIQNDGVVMGSHLGVILANTFMDDFERSVMSGVANKMKNW